VTVELDRDEPSGILASLLDRLRQACAEFMRDKDYGSPERMVLIGGPMRSPMVRAALEEAFRLPTTPVRDPQLAVAYGAAVQAAVLDGKCPDFLLLDITPLSLGIRVKGLDEDEFTYSELIEAHTTIPIRKSDIFRPADDNQTEVRIEISTAPSTQRPR
jgi:molecular chaperone DnaK